MNVHLIHDCILSIQNEWHPADQTTRNILSSMKLSLWSCFERFILINLLIFPLNTVACNRYFCRVMLSVSAIYSLLQWVLPKRKLHMTQCNIWKRGQAYNAEPTESFCHKGAALISKNSHVICNDTV